MRSLKPAKGFGEVVYPGYKGYHTQQERTMLGIPLGQKLLEQMNQIAGELAVKKPPCVSAETA
jgi:LDH2 family malate/lactate/ureidoglycolate dehydrogenase